ncbi:MAG: hypothetical protein ACT4OI_05700 [Methanobacteriota archaeon]
MNSVCEQSFRRKRLFVIRSVTTTPGGGAAFVPERNLKDLVVSYLRTKERSISALTKQLAQDGYGFHRLFVTGYLKALSDVGMLREKDIPPAKVYTASSHRERNLYELVGDRCRAANPDERVQTRLAVAVLQHLFRRPVFLREMRECGFAASVDAPAAPRDEREDARRALAKLGLQVPTNEPAYAVDERRNDARDAIVADLLVERFAMASLVLETKQTKLTER